MEEAIKTLLNTSYLRATNESGGGCISSGRKYEIDGGEFVFVKTNNKPDAKLMFDGEHASLEAIRATRTVNAPKSYGTFKLPDDTSVIVFEFIRMKSISNQALLGKKLAELHLFNENSDTPIRRFGFDVPTCCGYLALNNEWNDSWSDFYVNQRLQPHIDMLTSKHPNQQLSDLWNECKPKIQQILDRINPTPALLHGDLWSGNMASNAATNEPIIFDPASFYGHSEFDLGIAKMFGGFSKDFYQAYHEIIPKAEGFDQRLLIYELFHHLNHWNHFGSGYSSGSTRTLENKVKFTINEKPPYDKIEESIPKYTNNAILYDNRLRYAVDLIQRVETLTVIINIVNISILSLILMGSSSSKFFNRFTPEEKCSCGNEHMVATGFYHCTTTLAKYEGCSNKKRLYRHHFVQIVYFCDNCFQTFNKVYDFVSNQCDIDFGRIKCLCETGNHISKFEFDEKPSYDKIEEAITKFNKTVGKYDTLDNNSYHYAMELFNYLKQLGFNGNETKTAETKFEAIDERVRKMNEALEQRGLFI